MTTVPQTEAEMAASDARYRQRLLSLLTFGLIPAPDPEAEAELEAEPELEAEAEL